MSDLRVQSLGRVRFLLEGDQVRLRTRKHAALALYLMSAPGRDHPRGALADLFWGDLGARRRASLSQGLYEIRRRLGLDLETAGNWIRLPAGQLHFDADRLADAARRGEHERAVRLYSGEFAPGLCQCATRDYERWCERERTRYQCLAAVSLGILCDRYMAEGALDLLLTLTHSWARRFPTDDVAQLRFAEALATGGRPREAESIRRSIDPA